MVGLLRFFGGAGNNINDDGHVAVSTVQRIHDLVDDLAGPQ